MSRLWVGASDRERRPLRSPRVLSQEAQGEVVLLALDDGTHFRLNEVGGMVWGMCDGSHTLGDVVDAICAEFDATSDEVADDVVGLVEELAAERLIVEPA
jgi:pyrroloquinoline quinone biosynthesis protein D